VVKDMLVHEPQFKRDVTIKILPHNVLANTMMQERFEREAHIIASLEHSAIVPVYDYSDSNGQPYLVMRQMRGGSLADRIKQAPLNLSAASRIIYRIAAALDKAHSRGAIHRDLKPSNILFEEDGAPFLSDFGFVKVVEGTTGLTSGIIGTSGFMAPEMFSDAKLTPLIDIYALGVSLFQMLPDGCRKRLKRLSG
jgi:eukaryotic-like serine/threonine-protein kinase